MIKIYIIYFVVLLNSFFNYITKSLFIRLGNIYRKLTHKDLHFNSYILYNTNNYKQPIESKSIILIDCFPVPQWIFVNSVLVNELASKHNASINSFGLYPRSYKINKLYNSFNCINHIRLNFSASNEIKIFKGFKNILQTINSKRDLLNYHYEQINIGLDIYDTILKTGVPTINLKSFTTYKVIYLGFKHYFFANNLFNSGKVKSVLLSHDNYIYMGTIAKVAWKFQIPVYFANPFEIKKISRPFELYDKFKNYPKYFSSLDNITKEQGILWSKNLLKKRLSGEVGVMMSYQVKSAFGNQLIERQTLNTLNTKLVIATHCFFDSPNCLGWMLFPDFYEWISHLGQLSINLNYEWYIKPHNDYLPGTMEILNSICKKFPKIKLINPSTTWHQLYNEGVRNILTCYGSIGHELPLLGFKVINAAYNPHIAYSFNIHPNSIEEYDDYLKHSIKDTLDIDKNEVYEFFYVHKNLLNPNNLFFESTQNYLDSIKNGQNEYDYYLHEADNFNNKVLSYFRSNEF
jgi:hypothetical protein